MWLHISVLHIRCCIYLYVHVLRHTRHKCAAAQVYTVVVSHEQFGDLSPAAVSYTSGFYQIPVIGISSRDAAFSDKNIHVSFLRTVPPYYHQADVWLEMLSHFGYTKVSALTCIGGRNDAPAVFWVVDFFGLRVLIFTVFVCLFIDGFQAGVDACFLLRFL